MGPVTTPAFRGWQHPCSSVSPPVGGSSSVARCRQWRTMAPAEGRGAAARADTTCSGPALSTKRASRLPRGAGHGARGGDPEGNRAAMAASGTSEFALAFAVVTEWPVGCIHLAVEWSPHHARKGGWLSNPRVCFVG